MKAVNFIYIDGNNLPCFPIGITWSMVASAGQFHRLLVPKLIFPEWAPETTLNVILSRPSPK